MKRGIILGYLPNILTAIRFSLIPSYAILFFFNERYTAFGIWLLAGVTDILDGYIARKYNAVTNVGRMLDPLADKLMMLTVMVSLLWAGDLPWVAAGVIFARDVGMIICSAFFHFKGKKTVPANWMGKLTTILFYMAIFFVYFQWAYALPFLWVVILFSFITSWMYAVLLLELNKK